MWDAVKVIMALVILVGLGWMIVDRIRRGR